MERSDGFAPIGAYAAIGDGRTVALVAADGSVDFMSLTQMHAPTTFAALLDPERGGRFVLAPAQPFESARRYVDRTNVLETTFRTDSGVVEVTEALTLQDGGLLPWVELARRVDGVEGHVAMRWLLEPRFDWGRELPRVGRRGGLVLAWNDELQLGIHSWGAGEPQLGEHEISGEFEVGEGDCDLLVLTATHRQPIPAPRRDAVLARLDGTCRLWQRWLHGWRYEGPWPDAVARSALALKLLTYAQEGAIVAAPTTSLPERVGGDRNWDYRYAWVRDSAFTLDALMRLGLAEQVHESFSWLLRAVASTAPDVRPFYAVDATEPTREEHLEHLRGHRDSRPVRYGNAARAQLQLGSWGDLLETADLYVSRGNALDESTGRLLARCVDLLVALWRDPDCGMWELDTRRQNTSSKLGTWSAFDRALALVEGGHLPDAHAEVWREQRDAVHRWIEEHCWSEGLGAYKGWAGSDEALDASVLRGVRLGYPEQERLERTVDAIRERLSPDGVLLYRSQHLREREGAFLPCSFWLVEALARLGRVAEAREVMEELLRRANDVGLFSEEIDPRTGELLGNFPQGLSHLALINAAGAVQDAERPGS